MSLFLFGASSAHAEIKKQAGLWQLITLKQLLVVQQARLITPSPKQIKHVLPLQPTIFLSPLPPENLSTSEIQTFIMQEINVYRAKFGLSQVSTSAETCHFARIRAEEISHAFTHDGFNTRSHNGTIPYAKWTKVTENLANAPNYKDVVGLWADSPTHAANMRADTPYICVEKYGNYYAFEGLRL